MADQPGPDKPAVSVVVPVYNAESTLKDCLDSLLGLAYPGDRLQIIVVDNNSRDNSARILETYADRILMVREPRQGPGAARNRGAQVAGHELMAFTDADCVVDRQWLRNLVRPLIDQPGLAAVGGRILARPPANRVARFGEAMHDHEKAIKTYKPPTVITMNMAIRKSIFQEMGGFDETFQRGEDSDLGYRLFSRGAVMDFVGEAVIYHANERTLRGLCREGFRHGFWDVMVMKKHHATLFPGRSWIQPRSYVLLAASFGQFVKQSAATGQWAVPPLCDFVFNLGKKAGALSGSIRFGFWSL